MKRSLKKIIMLLILIVVIFAGCTKDKTISQYSDSATCFNEIYFQSVECIDLGNVIKSLEKLHTEKNKKNIEELSTLLEKIKNNIPKDKEKLYENFEQRYDNLVFLRDAYSKFKSLSKDDRSKVSRIFISIGMNKTNWNNKDSSIVWQ